MSQYSGSYVHPQQAQMKPSDWVELDDRYNMIDETQIEPDFFVDLAVSSSKA